MAESFISVAPNKPAGATPTAIYTPTASSTGVLMSLVCANNSGAAGADDQVTIRKVPSGGGAGDADIELVDELVVPKQESFYFAEKVVLNDDESISVESANGTVVFTLSALERT